MSVNRRKVAAAVIWLMCLTAGTAAAQETFPSRSIRIVIPYSPGSVADVFARIRQKLGIAGCEPAPAAPKQFADIVKADIALWAKVVKEAGITAD